LAQSEKRGQKLKLKLLILHGPNLNLLGEREPEIYGSMSLAQLNQKLKKSGREMGMTLRIFQSNGEGELIHLLHQHRKWADGVVFNPGAYTHYSYALRDAVSAIQIPVIEVHLSDIKKREPFRRKSVIAPVCLDQISGLGWESYLEGLKRLKARFQAAPKPSLKTQVRLSPKLVAKSFVLGFGMAGFAALFNGYESKALSFEILGGLTKPGVNAAAPTVPWFSSGTSGPAVQSRSAPLQLGAGVLLDAFISPDLDFQYGLIYATRGGAFSLGGVTSTYSVPAIELPFVLRKSWMRSFSIGVGGYAAYALGSETWINPLSGMSSMLPFDLGLVASADLRVRIFPFFRLVADIRYLYGLTNLSQSTVFTTYSNDFQVFAGLRFGR
jgi:3-dehydroquinate dehydratase-2